MLEVCENKHVEMLLIAGDLFHRQPLRRELKELDYLFSKLSMTQVVIIAGNHDYLKQDSYYRTFPWSKNVHMILDRDITCVEFPAYSLAVYGMSYDEKQITEECYRDAFAQRRQPYEILLAHGGDDSHIPIKKENLLGLGYDYVAMGHIHKPQVICPDKIAYSGALEPIDKNDTGAHGYIYGEITTKGCRIKFVPFATRSYIHQTIDVNPSMTEHELKETIAKVIDEKGKKNIYKIILDGLRDPDISYDVDTLDPYGNVIEITDQTRPAYRFDKLKEANKGNILGAFVAELEHCPEDSLEYQALCEGVRALMETRRG